MENVVEEKKTERKEFNLKEVFVLWKHKDKNDSIYLSGYTSEENKEKVSLIGFYNTDKQNEKAPDIKIYTTKEDGSKDKEIASLWINTSKDGNMYLNGTTSEDKKIIGFYTKELINDRPDIKVYYKED